MTLAELKDQFPAMVALVERALNEELKVDFTTSRRAENFRRSFYKFRREAFKHLNEDDAKKVKSITTTVSGKQLIFNTKQVHAPKELLEALGLQ